MRTRRMLITVAAALAVVAAPGTASAEPCGDWCGTDAKIGPASGSAQVSTVFERALDGAAKQWRDVRDGLGL